MTLLTLLEKRCGKHYLDEEIESSARKKAKGNDGAPLKAFTMIDAYRIGQVAHTTAVAANLLLADGVMDDDSDGEDIVDNISSDSRYKAITEVMEHRSRYVGSQLFEIKELTETFFKESPLSIRMINGWALKVANRLPISDDIAVGTMGCDEKAATAALGRLIFLLLRDKEVVRSCLRTTDLSRAKERLHMAAVKELEGVRGAIESHALSHKRSGLQGYEDTYYQKMSVEMAKILLLPSKSINIGIIDDCMDILVPEEWRHYRSIGRTREIMEQVKCSPELWQMLSEVKKPLSTSLPSNLLIRVCLGLPREGKLTNEDARTALLSALIGHVRQDNAGTCFSTAWMIDTMHGNLAAMIEDFATAIEYGHMKRAVHGDIREFPFYSRTTKDGLEVRIIVNEELAILQTDDHELSPAAQADDDKPEGSVKLWQAPGFIAAARALGLSDRVEGIFTSYHKHTLKDTYAVKELLKELGRCAFDRQLSLRSGKKKSLDECINIANYAYVSETNHPLHRAWEQINATLVDYFNSQYYFPHWTFEALEITFDTMKKQLFKSNEEKRMLSTLLEHMFLPMIVRMRYRYNPYIEEEYSLFGEISAPPKNHYGYELCDGGLPSDFKYSTKLRRELKGDTSWIHLNSYKGYAPAAEWKVIKSGEEFQQFVQKMIVETIEYITEEVGNSRSIEEWEAFKERLCGAVANKRFVRLMTEYIIGRHSSQKKKLDKNPHDVVTRPWRFFWGGNPYEVVKLYHDCSHKPVKELEYTGTPKEVLSWHLNHLRKLPEEILDSYKDSCRHIVITSPNHVFLFQPNDEGVVRALASGLPPTQYVVERIERPGIALAQQVATTDFKGKLLEFVADNRWASRSHEKHDFLRQQLTEESKEILERKFDEFFDSTPFPMDSTIFIDTVVLMVGKSRAADARIGKRNKRWEMKLRTALKSKIKVVMITVELARELAAFVLHRIDSVKLDAKEHEKLHEKMREVVEEEETITISDYRTLLLKTASQLRYDSSGIKEKHWKEIVAPALDTYLFKQLPKEMQEQFLETIITPYDSNWKDGAQDIYLAYMVNPGSSKLEMCRYCPDSKAVKFMNLRSWFPRQQGRCWSTPDLYLRWSDEPAHTWFKLCK